MCVYGVLLWTEMTNSYISTESTFIYTKTRKEESASCEQHVCVTGCWRRRKILSEEKGANRSSGIDHMGTVSAVLTCPPRLPRPENTVVSPLCAGTCRRERVRDSFSSERSSGLDNDRRAADKHNNCFNHSSNVWTT